MTPARSLDILYHDSHFVVVNKPDGLLSVPGRGSHKQDCVVNRLKALVPSCIAQPAVHRLDMATSGLMVLALTTGIHAAFLSFSHPATDKRVSFTSTPPF
jgi:tRNA pseudouridine32 synthase/23S rRNA pseudouridine746 synthase